MPQIVRTLDEALAPIADGSVLSVPRESTGVAMRQPARWAAAASSD